MPYCCTKTIQQFFKRYGWAFRCVNKKHVQTGWQHNNKIYKLDVHLTDTFVCFQVKILQLVEHIDRRVWLHTIKHLLNLNEQVRFIRISVDKTLHVYASAEVLRSGFTFQHLEHILGILAYYTESIEVELRKNLSN